MTPRYLYSLTMDRVASQHRIKMSAGHCWCLGGRSIAFVLFTLMQRPLSASQVLGRVAASDRQAARVVGVFLDLQYLNPRSKGKQEVELEYKNYVNVCVCVRACVCSYMCVKMTSSICVCVGVRACVRVCAEKSLAHLTLRKLRDPARIATKDDCFDHRSWPPGRSQSFPGTVDSISYVRNFEQLPTQARLR